MRLGSVALQVPRPEHLMRAERTAPLQIGLARVMAGKDLRASADAPGSLAVATHQELEAAFALQERARYGPAEGALRPHTAALLSERTFDEAKASRSGEQSPDLASPLAPLPSVNLRRRPGPRRRAEGGRGGEAASLPPTLDWGILVGHDVYTSLIARHQGASHE
jgi:hypothetical protein